jgi:hypothetical protein
VFFSDARLAPDAVGYVIVEKLAACFSEQG